MEGQLLCMLIIQLSVIFFVAICIIYFILKKLVGKSRIPSVGSKSILITAADTIIGTQISRHLASLGFRVFAGVSDLNSKASSRLRSGNSPWLHIVPLDVTNDESLAYSIKVVKEHFHAGEKGLWAVIHLAGTGAKTNKQAGGDDEQFLRTALEITVVGMLRLIRATLPLLSATKGRFIILGADDGKSLGLRVWGGGSIGVTHGVWTAARFAAEGLAAGLRAQLKPHGVRVISLHPDAYYAQRIHEVPSPSIVYEMRPESLNDTGRELEHIGYDILSKHAIKSVEDAILANNPEQAYVLTPSTSSRIKSMMYAFSPTCVSTAILKQHKLLNPTDPYTIV